MNKLPLEKILLFSILYTAFYSTSSAQDLRTFNQNASRSNHTRLGITVSPVYSTPFNQSSDSLLFRGNGGGFRFGADYFLGKAGIGFSSGFSSSSSDNGMINNFLKKAGIPQDQLIITRSKQQNMYLLLGPSIRFGNAVEFSAYAKGGLFINNSGLVDIQQRGASKTLYRNESTEKSIFPGFLTGLNVQYNIQQGVWSIGLAVDYMNTKSEVNNYDYRRAGGTEALQLSRNIQDIVAGITIRYNIFSSREAGSGMATGRRSREAGSGMATGRRVLPTVNKREIVSPRDAQSGLPTGRRSSIAIDESGVHRMATENCGPVTVTTTNPDGTTEEMTFACPEDAAQYNRSVNPGNTTASRQTQGTSFGEKAMNGLHKENIVHRDIAARNLISGTVVWTNNQSYGIVTNNSIRNDTKMSIPPSVKGLEVSIYAREAGSGLATGKRSREAGSGMATGKRIRETGSGMSTGKRIRETGSGMATGKRQHSLVYNDGTGEVCNPCLATVKSSNPLYADKGNSGTNPLYQGKTAGHGNEFCGTTQHLIAVLTDPNGGVIAKTNVEPCGDFWFANVPDGDYIVRISGDILVQKSYDVVIPEGKDVDIAGEIVLPYDQLGVLINTSADEEMQQKAGISTSRSNIRTKRFVIIDADTDGDGETETTKVMAELSDGTSKDVTDAATVSKSSAGKKVTVRGWDPEKKEAVSKQYEITINNGEVSVDTRDGGEFRHEANVMAKIGNHPNVVQYTIPVEEDDEMASVSPAVNMNSFNITSGDLDGDGIADMAVGNGFSGGQQLRPGNPIGGLTIKGGKNPGGNLSSRQTNENGEFEFVNLEPGSYTFTVGQTIFIENETLVTTGSNTKAQDHNSSRSNKTASRIATDPGNDNSSGTKAQDHNSSRSNKTASVIDTDNDNTNSKKDIGPVKWMAPESMKRSINTTHTQLDNMLSLLDELDEQLDNDQNNTRTGINTSRSNIKNQRAAINSLQQTLDNLQQKDKNAAMNELEQKRNETDLQFLKLQQSLQSLGSRYTTISNVLKTRHETAMNSIRNIKA